MIWRGYADSKRFVTTAAEDIAAALKAIRKDDLVGRGTCSMVDEAMTDEEVIAEFIIGADGKPLTPLGAVRKARAAHRLWVDHLEDIRGTAF